MATDYALDEQDLDTHRFVSQIAHGADHINMNVINSKSLYNIDNARVVGLGDPHYVGTPINPLAVRLDLSLVGYESEPGHLTQLVNDNARSLDQQKDDGVVRDRSTNTTLLYKVNEGELKTMIDGGLYENPQQYNHDLDLVMKDQQFVVPDQMRVTSMQFHGDDPMPGIQVGNQPSNQTYSITSVQPQSVLTTFDQSMQDNSFPNVFRQMTQGLIHRRAYPEDQNHDIVAMAEMRQQQQQEMINQRLRSEGKTPQAVVQPSQSPIQSQPRRDATQSFDVPNYQVPDVSNLTPPNLSTSSADNQQSQEQSAQSVAVSANTSEDGTPNDNRQAQPSQGPKSATSTPNKSAAANGQRPSKSNDDKLTPDDEIHLNQLLDRIREKAEQNRQQMEQTQQNHHMQQLDHDQHGPNGK